MLGKLAAAYGLSISRLIALAEEGFEAHLTPARQPVWRDPESGFVRRTVSPPDRPLSGEVVACELPAGARIAYDRPPRPGLEHHLWLRDGALTVTLGAVATRSPPATACATACSGRARSRRRGDSGARYLLFIV